MIKDKPRICQVIFMPICQLCTFYNKQRVYLYHHKGMIHREIVELNFINLS